MQQEKKYRHENKYAVTEVEYIAMRQRLKAIMKTDPHTGNDGKYLIRSVYFDNYSDKALREKVDGVEKREKFRIRYYNDDFSFITLEKKMKIGNLCQKIDAPITEEQFRKILDGDTEWMREYPDGLVRELYAKMKYQRLRPRVVVSYVREPYIYTAGNVRVTFDSEIKTSLFTKDYLSPHRQDISATDTPQDRILEIKYDAFLPDVIRDIVRTPAIRQQAFSKYGACRRYG